MEEGRHPNSMTQPERIRKSNISANGPQYDFLIRSYRANPLQALFTVDSCLAIANSRLNVISLVKIA